MRRSMRCRPASHAGCTRLGFFSYELGYCLEPKLRDLLPADRRVPLFWIGLFRAPLPLDDASTRAWLDANGGTERAKISDLTLSWTREQYTSAFDKVEDYISAGDVYQINLTLKYRFAFEGDPVALYAALRRKQRVAYGALIGAPGFRRPVAVARALLPPRGQAHVDAPDEGHGAARPHPARGCAAQDLARHGREAARREFDDRRSLAQRSRPRRQDRLGRGDRPLHRGDLPLGASDDLRHLRPSSDPTWGSRTCSARCSRAAR